MRAGRVAVLMATFNGQAYLREQLASLDAQTWAGVDLLVSDDGSTDGTPDLVRRFARDWNKGSLAIVEGPRQGFAENFRSLILRQDASRASYVAFCDQDDIWNGDKLEKAVAWLSSRPPGTPALYCGRTLNFAPERRSMSPLFPHKPCFANALVQSIAGGNTMVMNRAAFELVQTAARRSSFVSHDWLSYLIVTGAGGEVFYNPVPDVLYRQHQDNLVGANDNWIAVAQRISFVLNGRFREWTDRNLQILEDNKDLLTPEARQTLQRFRSARHAPLHKRLAALRQSGVFRQTRKGHAALAIAALMKLL